MTIRNYRDPVAASYDENGYLLIRTPYNPNFIKEFKDVVPYNCRRWNAEDKVWVITDSDFHDDVINMLGEYFPNFEIGDV